MKKVRIKDNHPLIGKWKSNYCDVFDDLGTKFNILYDKGFLTIFAEDCFDKEKLQTDLYEVSENMISFRLKTPSTKREVIQKLYIDLNNNYCSKILYQGESILKNNIINSKEQFEGIWTSIKDNDLDRYEFTVESAENIRVIDRYDLEELVVSNLKLNKKIMSFCFKELSSGKEGSISFRNKLNKTLIANYCITEGEILLKKLN